MRHLRVRQQRPGAAALHFGSRMRRPGYGDRVARASFVDWRKVLVPAAHRPVEVCPVAPLPLFGPVQLGEPVRYYFVPGAKTVDLAALRVPGLCLVSPVRVLSRYALVLAGSIVVALARLMAVVVRSDNRICAAL